MSEGYLEAKQGSLLLSPRRCSWTLGQRMSLDAGSQDCLCMLPLDAEPVSLATNSHSPLGPLGVLSARTLPGEGEGKGLATAQSRQNSHEHEPGQSPRSTRDLPHPCVGDQSLSCSVSPVFFLLEGSEEVG